MGVVDISRLGLWVHSGNSDSESNDNARFCLKRTQNSALSSLEDLQGICSCYTLHWLL